MTYNIFSKTAPEMPKTGRGTELVKFALSKAPKSCKKLLILMATPALSAHLTETKFMHKAPNITRFAGKCGF